MYHSGSYSPSIVLESTRSTTNNSDTVERILMEKIDSSKMIEELRKPNSNSDETEFLSNTIDENFDLSDLKAPNDEKDSSYYLKTQKWIGYIIDILGETLYCELHDLNNPTTYETVEFNLMEIPREDRECVKKGAGFYFSVGSAYDNNGQLERKSLIRFQRIKNWDESEFDSLMDEVDMLYNKLKWE